MRNAARRSPSVLVMAIAVGVLAGCGGGGGGGGGAEPPLHYFAGPRPNAPLTIQVGQESTPFNDLSFEGSYDRASGAITVRSRGAEAWDVFLPTVSYGAHNVGVREDVTFDGDGRMVGGVLELRFYLEGTRIRIDPATGGYTIEHLVSGTVQPQDTVTLDRTTFVSAWSDPGQAQRPRAASYVCLLLGLALEQVRKGCGLIALVDQQSAALAANVNRRVSVPPSPFPTAPPAGVAVQGERIIQWLDTEPDGLLGPGDDFQSYLTMAWFDGPSARDDLLDGYLDLWAMRWDAKPYSPSGRYAGVVSTLTVRRVIEDPPGTYTLEAGSVRATGGFPLWVWP